MAGRWELELSVNHAVSPNRAMVTTRAAALGGSIPFDFLLSCSDSQQTNRISTLNRRESDDGDSGDSGDSLQVQCGTEDGYECIHQQGQAALTGWDFSLLQRSPRRTSSFLPKSLFITTTAPPTTFILNSLSLVPWCKLQCSPRLHFQVQPWPQV
jgi:hypothetical protein